MVISTDRAELDLQLNDVSRRFGGRTIFAGISAEASVGRSIVITGQNGSGKSTLLRIIAGLLSPSSGSVRITKNGETYNPIARRELIGYVAPDLMLYRELSAVENLRFFGQARGFEPDIDHLRSLLAFVGLRGRGREIVGNYSSGMRQRLKYAFALLHKPRLLLLDEPTANLDSGGIEMVREVVERQKANGVLVMATNDPQEAAWGDAVVNLDTA